MNENQGRMLSTQSIECDALTQSERMNILTSLFKVLGRFVNGIPANIDELPEEEVREKIREELRMTAHKEISRLLDLRK
jgi:hypothetical protein